MNMIATFIANHWVSIAIVIAAIVILAILYKMGHTEIVKKIVLSLVVQAEKALGSGTGELKYAMVIKAIYNELPKIITLLYTPKELDKMIEDGVSKLKEMLAEGITLDGYDEESLKIDLEIKK